MVKTIPKIRVRPGLFLLAFFQLNRYYLGRLFRAGQGLNALCPFAFAL